MTEVTILTQASCVSCTQAKEIFSRLALEYPINVHEEDLNTEIGRALALKHGVMFAPGVLVNGKLFSFGRLSEKKLRKHLSEQCD